MRQALVSISLCFVPVLLAPMLGAVLFPDTIGKQFASVDASSAVVLETTPAGESVVNEDPQVGFDVGPGESAWQTVSADSHFDPDSNSDFILFLRFRATSPAKLGKRKLFIKKYIQGQKKPVGWAFALKRFDTSIRPELFINDTSGHGEWFTFDTLAVEPGRWIQLFLIRRKDGSTGLLSRQDGDTQLKSLGGYDTSPVDLSKNLAELMLAPPVLDGADFKGEIGEIAIIRPAELPKSEPKLVRLLDEYTKAREETFSEGDIKLLMLPNQPLRVER